MSLSEWEKQSPIRADHTLSGMAGVPEVVHKVVFLGDSNTGKTSIINKYRKLARQPSPTIAASSFSITIPLRGSPVHISCWDTAGQEGYRCLVPMYARGAEVACLVFDQTNKQSFDALQGWLDYIQSDIGIPCVVVVSNKNDLEPVVPLDEAFEFCTERKLPLVATSAVTGSNVTFLFMKVAHMIHEATVRRLQREKGVRIDEEKEQKECC
jgi:small GTP-binding protein